MVQRKKYQRDVVEFFYELDDGDKDVPPRFQCENCGGIMELIQYITSDGIIYTLNE